MPGAGDLGPNQGALLRKQPHQAQRLHIGSQGKAPAGKPLVALMQLQGAHTGVVKMTQIQRWQPVCGVPNRPAGPVALWAAGQQAALCQGQQALGKTKLRIQVNHQGGQNVFLSCEL